MSLDDDYAGYKKIWDFDEPFENDIYEEKVEE